MTVKVLVVAGYGPGISHNVALRFGGQGYKVALLSRTQSKLDEAAKAFNANGIIAKGFAVDLAKADKVSLVIASIRSQFGPIAMIHWNAYGPSTGIFDATAENLQTSFNLSTTSLVIAAKEAFEDLKAAKGSILVTGGGLGIESDSSVSAALQFHAVSLAIAKSAQRKATSLLSESFKPHGIYTGMVAVNGIVKGPGIEYGISPELIADTFVTLNEKRERLFEQLDF
ncbi:hypothetical protein HDU97_004999 [Phlyctochytrium planicorne]|nr:hypothetical protein HDU97_004999 [Phlyctochytrium planicorne]